MQEQVSEIIFYVKGTLKYKWVALIFAWVICLFGWLYVLAMPNQFLSQARVQVDSRTMLRPLLRGLTISTDVSGLVHIMQQLMFTQQNLKQIIKLSGLNKTIGNSALEEFELVEQLKSEIKIASKSKNNDLFTISYESTDPSIAKQVVQAVLAIFSEQTNMRALGDVDSAQRFIREQILEYEARLRNAEQARENFKRVNFGLLPEQSGGQLGQISELDSQMEEARLSLTEAISRRNVLQEQFDDALDSDEDWGLLAGVSQDLSPEDAKIQEYLSNRTDLLLKYTENHPEVKAIDSIILTLEQRKAENTGDFLDDSSEGAMANPYVQQLQTSVNQADAQIAALQSRINNISKRQEKIESELNMRLKVETEMQNLNRDYATIKSNYTQLLQRREQATISEKVDMEAAALKFKIADPPNTPLKPSSPNRVLLSTAILFISLGLGFGIAFLLYFIRPTFMSTKQLRTISGLPVLGSVSLLRLEEVTKQKKHIQSFNFVFFSLVFVYFGFLAMATLSSRHGAAYQYLQGIYWKLNFLVGG